MRGRRGSNAVEFALTLPVLLLLAAGVVDLGQYLRVADAAVAAAAEGARAGSLVEEDQAAIGKTMAERAWIAADLDGTALVVATVSGVDPNARLQVDVTVPYAPFFGFLALPPTVTYSHTMRLLHQPEP